MGILIIRIEVDLKLKLRHKAGGEIGCKNTHLLVLKQQSCMSHIYDKKKL
jgi:hypothetical protein